MHWAGPSALKIDLDFRDVVDALRVVESVIPGSFEFQGCSHRHASVQAKA